MNDAIDIAAMALGAIGQPLILLAAKRLPDRAKIHRRNVDRVVHPRYLSDAVEREIENIEIA